MPLTAAYIQSCHAAIAAMVPGAVVVVECDGDSAQGVRYNRRATGDAGLIGESGSDTATVMLKADELEAVDIGSTITVNGQDARVLNVRPDPAGGVKFVDYQVANAIEGGE